MSAPKRPRQDSDDWSDSQDVHSNKSIAIPMVGQRADSDGWSDSQEDHSNEHTTDFSFICGKGAGEVRFPVNTDILRAKSDVFKVMFQNRLPEDNEIRFGDISVHVFKAFLLCLFNNKPFAMDFDVIVKVMHLCKYYEVGDNLKFVTNLIIRPFVPQEDVINAFALAVEYNFPLNSWKELIETHVLN